MLEKFRSKIKGKFAKKFFLLFKLVTSFALIIFLVNKLNISSVNIDAFRNEFTLLILGVITLLFTFTIIEGYRLYILIKNIESFYSVLRLTLIGFFFSSFLPSSLGGDSIKILYLKRKLGLRWIESSTIVFLERFSGMFALFIIGVLYLSFFYQKLSSVVLNIDINTKIVIIILILIVFAFLLILMKFPQLKAKIRYFFSESYKIIVKTPLKKHLQLFISSLIYQLFRLVAFYFLIYYFGETICWIDLFFLLFFTAFISILPISIGGLGIQEGAIVISLVVFNIPENIAILVAFLNRLIIVFLSILGSMIYFFSDFYRIKKLI